MGTNIGVALVLLVYLAPSIVAFSRGTHNRYQLAFWNVIAGWSLLVWVLGLYAALLSNPEARSTYRRGGGSRNVLSNAELNKMRKRIEPTFTR